ncbi:HD-GYP domain-containing protein, partial [candidate division KSB1 bacterium]
MPEDILKRDIVNAFYGLDDLLDIPGFLGKNDIDEVIANYFEDCSYLPRIHEFVAMKGYDEATYMHSLRVGALSWVALKSIGKKYNKSQMAEYCAAGILHDCGKKEVAQEILQTKGKITKEQYDEVKTHTEKGVSVMEKILEGDGVNTELIELIVKYHHEDMNGKGYQKLIDSEKFNGYVQLVAIADV